MEAASSNSTLLLKSQERIERLAAASEHVLIFSGEKSIRHGDDESAQETVLVDAQPITVDDRPTVIIVHWAETAASPASHKVHNRTANSHDHCQVDVLLWLVCLPLMVSLLLSKLRVVCQPVASDASCMSS